MCCKFNWRGVNSTRTGPYGDLPYFQCVLWRVHLYVLTYVSHPSLAWQAVRNIYVTPVSHMAGGALRLCYTRHSHGRRSVTYVSHPSLTWQAVRYVCVTPVTHTAGSALCLCHTRHSHGRRCVKQMSHPSLTWRAVRYVCVIPVSHMAGGALCMLSHYIITHLHAEAVTFAHGFHR
jgi:hypothetical protein